MEFEFCIVSVSAIVCRAATRKEEKFFKRMNCGCCE